MILNDNLVKLNRDGACKSNGEIAGCGGVFAIQMVGDLRDLVVKLEVVLHSMQRYGVSIWDFIWLEEKVYLT